GAAGPGEPDSHPGYLGGAFSPDRPDGAAFLQGPSGGPCLRPGGPSVLGAAAPLAARGGDGPEPCPCGCGPGGSALPPFGRKSRSSPDGGVLGAAWVFDDSRQSGLGRDAAQADGYGQRTQRL